MHNRKALTIAWNPRVGDVHVHRQLFASTAVYYDGRVRHNASVVDELDGREREDDRRGNNSHFRVEPAALDRCPLRAARMQVGLTHGAGTRLDLDVFHRLRAVASGHYPAVCPYTRKVLTFPKASTPLRALRKPFAMLRRCPEAMNRVCVGGRNRGEGE